MFYHQTWIKSCPNNLRLFGGERSNDNMYEAVPYKSHSTIITVQLIFWSNLGLPVSVGSQQTCCYTTLTGVTPQHSLLHLNRWDWEVGAGCYLAVWTPWSLDMAGHTITISIVVRLVLLSVCRHHGIHHGVITIYILNIEMSSCWIGAAYFGWPLDWSWVDILIFVIYDKLNIVEW